MGLGTASTSTVARESAPPRDPARHPIRWAASAAGCHPQTLREYERHGLVRPERTEGGTRLYLDRDVEVARRVRELTDDGYAFVAIERILRLEQRIRTLIAHVRILEDQNMRLSSRLSRAAS